MTLKETGSDDALWIGEHLYQRLGVIGHTASELGVGKLQSDNQVLGSGRLHTSEISPS